MPPQIINAVADEEKDLVNKYNRSLIADASWVGGLLLIAFLVLGWWQSPIPLTGWNTAIFAGGSAALFIGFQIFFYFLIARQYNYPTSPELELAAIKGLNKALTERAKESE